MPLALAAMPLDGLPVPRIITALTPHTSRIAALYINTERPRSAEAFIVLLTQPWPILTSLTLILNYDEPKWVPMLSPTHEQFPRLRKLKIRHVRLLWPLSFSHELVSLNLDFHYERAAHPDEERPTLPILLETLRACPRLEMLMLSSVAAPLKELAGPTHAYPEHECPVHLPELCDLDVWNDDAVDSAYLLAHLRFPASTIVHVKVNLPQLAPFELFAPALPRTPRGADYAALPILGTTQGLSLTVGPTGIVLRAIPYKGGATKGRIPRLKVHVFAIEGLDLYASFSEIVEEAAQAFAGAPVRALRIVSNIDYKQDVAYELQRGALDPFRCLEELTVESNHAARPILDVLGAAPEVQSEDDTLVLPSLRTLRIIVEDIQEHPTWEAVFAMLEYRASRGGRLHELVMQEEAGRGVRPEYGDMLEELVDKWSYPEPEPPTSSSTEYESVDDTFV
ncbi:hypothetical protein A0H81_06746 [Grifola frondosa]|uniref:F-box domain-containing protein n=1 Tax=Grifola frondosa TaxID=5627 RepID=A0A1C7M869_GRIFR|nr:hypothetical protein A0H81_06746 [Grifola frondosa]